MGLHHHRLNAAAASEIGTFYASVENLPKQNCLKISRRNDGGSALVAKGPPRSRESSQAFAQLCAPGAPKPLAFAAFLGA
jgi:hypothetical protein